MLFCCLNSWLHRDFIVRARNDVRQERRVVWTAGRPRTICADLAKPCVYPELTSSFICMKPRGSQRSFQNRPSLCTPMGMVAEVLPPQQVGAVWCLNLHKSGAWVALSVEVSAFGSDHDDLRVLGSSPMSGSLLSQKPAAPSLSAHALALSLSQINKNLFKKIHLHKDGCDVSVCCCLTGLFKGRNELILLKHKSQANNQKSQPPEQSGRGRPALVLPGRRQPE